MNYKQIPFHAGMAGYDADAPGEGYLSGPSSKGVKVILRGSKTMPPGLPGFFQWLSAAHPDLYAQMHVRYPNLALYLGDQSPAPVLAGMGDTSLTPIDVTAQTMTAPSDVTSSGTSQGIFSQIVSSLSQLAPTVIATVDQQKIFNTQLSRAQNGLPPLNTSSYGLPSMQGAVNSLLLPVVLVGGGIALLAFAKRR